MSALKPFELGFRRLFLRFLSFTFRSKRIIPSDIDLNKCKFLFLRQDLIGDALVSTPVFDLLKRKYPGAIIDVLLSPRNQFVLQNDPTVRRRWIYRKSWIDIRRLRRNLRQERYDFVVDLVDNPSTTSTLWCLVAGARWKVGLAKENDFAYDFPAPLLPKENYHIVERTANVLLAFGIQPKEESLRIRYHVGADAERFAGEFWLQSGLVGATVVGVNISAGDEVRSWWGENCRRFLRDVSRSLPSCKILLIFKPEDRHKAELIGQAIPSVLLSPTTPSFDHVTALVKRLNYLVTPDTSIVQIAAAFEIPSVVLHLKVSTIHGHLWEPYGSDSENLVAPTDNVDIIPSTDVLEAFERLVKRHSSQRRPPLVQSGA